MSLCSSSDKRPSVAKRVAAGGIFSAAALILSYLESFLPVGVLLGIPGLKLGFANIAVIITFYLFGGRLAVCVSLLRIAVSALLFGSVTSFVFSLFGGILSLLVLFLTRPIYKKRIGLIGISVLSAAMHNIGQMCAAALMMSETGVFLYLSVLLLASIPCGALIGAVSNLLLSSLQKHGIGDL